MAADAKAAKRISWTSQLVTLLMLVIHMACGMAIYTLATANRQKQKTVGDLKDDGLAGRSSSSTREAAFALLVLVATAWGLMGVAFRCCASRPCLCVLSCLVLAETGAFVTMVRPTSGNELGYEALLLFVGCVAAFAAVAVMEHQLRRLESHEFNDDRGEIVPLNASGGKLRSATSFTKTIGGNAIADTVHDLGSIVVINHSKVSSIDGVQRLIIP